MGDNDAGNTPTPDAERPLVVPVTWEVELPPIVDIDAEIENLLSPMGDIPDVPE